MMRTLSVLILLSPCVKKVYVYPRHCPLPSKIPMDACVAALGGDDSGVSSFNHITVEECASLKGKRKWDHCIVITLRKGLK